MGPHDRRSTFPSGLVRSHHDKGRRIYYRRGSGRLLIEFSNPYRDQHVFAHGIRDCWFPDLI
jgi:hypothetical protein